MEITIDHFTLKTNQLEATKQFFINLFELEEIERPQMIQQIPGCWLGKKDKAIIHLINSYEISESVQLGGIDHIGLVASSQQYFIKKIKEMKLLPAIVTCEELHREHIYLKTPCGTTIETIFELQ